MCYETTTCLRTQCKINWFRTERTVKQLSPPSSRRAGRSGVTRAPVASYRRGTLLPRSYRWSRWRPASLKVTIIRANWRPVPRDRPRTGSGMIFGTRAGPRSGLGPGSRIGPTSLRRAWVRPSRPSLRRVAPWSTSWVSPSMISTSTEHVCMHVWCIRAACLTRIN